MAQQELPTIERVIDYGLLVNRGEHPEVYLVEVGGIPIRVAPEALIVVADYQVAVCDGDGDLRHAFTDMLDTASEADIAEMP